MQSILTNHIFKSQYLGLHLKKVGTIIGTIVGTLLYKSEEFLKPTKNKKCENVMFPHLFSAPCRIRTGDLLIKR